MMKHFYLLILGAGLMLYTAGCGDNALNGSEQAAVDFYKEVWVEGDTNHSQGMLDHVSESDDLQWRVEQTTSGERKNPPIMVTVSPTDSQMFEKTILIHRPSDKRDFKVRVRRTNGRWRVTKFEQNYDKQQGGYINNDAYQRYQEEYPALTWKRVEQP